MRWIPLLTATVLCVSNRAMGETITSPSAGAAWSCPGSHGFQVTGCNDSTNYYVFVTYKNNAGNWTELHSESCTSVNNVINKTLAITATPDPGRHDGKVLLKKFVYSPTPHWEDVGTVLIYVDGPTP